MFLFKDGDNNLDCLRKRNEKNVKLHEDKRLRKIYRPLMIWDILNGDNDTNELRRI